MVVATNRRPLSGRRREKDILRRLVRSVSSEFLAVYGRRRVGKTFLVRRFFQDEQLTYFELVGRADGTVREHLQLFAESLSRTFHDGARLVAPSTWHDAFRALEDAIEKRRTRKDKVVLFFDELPWIATHRSGALAALEHFWNAWCSRRDDIVLIVCGSAASWMLRNVVHARGGLHNRLTATIRLLPLTLPEVKELLDERKIRFTQRDLIELYMIFGGVPHYLDRIERGVSVAQVVDRICLDKDGALAGEFDRVFASLFGADPAYRAVVRALASKRRGLTRNELLAAAKLQSGGGATTILENLEEAGFIASAIPFGRTSRDRFFRLTDEFALFHMKWMDTAIKPKSWQGVRRTPRWQAWAGLAFESICLAHVDAIEHALGIAGVETRASAWLGEGAQIDLLIDRADNVISVCEAKFTEGPFVITKKYANELRSKLAVFRAQTGTRKATQLVLIAANGLTANAYSDEIVDRTITTEALFA